MESWYKEADVPDQTGRTYLVTGANTGIGWDTARVLAERGAKVLLGCRNEEKALDAIQRIKSRREEADLVWLPLDLSDLTSVKHAADQALAETRLDVLINNAGIMMPPLTRTAEGFESQFGVNHLGHFALTGLLLGKLNEQVGSRVVNVSSLAHRTGRMQWEDLNSERSYSPSARYSMSKLANLLFTFELQRRLEETDANTITVACHPGGTDTDLGRHMPPLFNAWIKPMASMMLNSSAEGALPTLMAATDDVRGGEYFGPRGFMEIVRSAKRVQSTPQARSATDAARLWDISVQMTGIQPDI